MPLSKGRARLRGLPLAAYTQASVCATSVLCPWSHRSQRRAASTADSGTGSRSNEVHAYWL
jgi:hypothetical protein